MHRKEHARPMAIAPMLSAGTRGPRWRALLEARWRARLEEVAELSLIYHGAAAADPDGHGDGDGDGQQETQRLLRRTVAARRKLADVDEALSRLAAGNFGYCEACGSAIPAGLLAVIPERRHCPRCENEPAPGRPGPGGTRPR
jgi:DnaK suppressor protein